ncbi:hydroxymethylbilane synthase [Plasmodium inui San Antonio 1]|uniref:Hydroxymethylbilane synthase n=1 Tax=Plasmodium inui San Antonio 1 TaxID=1237626 RepID=W7ABU9_9APIC|nr:hydroxymethylbilane synthase [Plasmodium inui San Antonio 1]EUD66539.1 hydroxymethylbilane synthase [Plasmodium inui San Antonio 1]
MENDKRATQVKIDLKEQQWRIFEYNMSKWMIENKYILDKEEKKKFYKCANYSIGSGIINASLVYCLCKRNKKFFTPMSRFFLTFSFGMYTSMIVNKIFRRKAYMEILTENTTMTDKVREVMNDILNVKDDVGKAPSTGSANKLDSTSTSNVYSKGLYDDGQAQIHVNPPSKDNVSSLAL